jgi:hypothetical protein
MEEPAVEKSFALTAELRKLEGSCSTTNISLGHSRRWCLHSACPEGSGLSGRKNLVDAMTIEVDDL